jgi:hypothetical protein
LNSIPTTRTGRNTSSLSAHSVRGQFEISLKLTINDCYIHIIFYVWVNELNKLAQAYKRVETNQTDSISRRTNNHNYRTGQHK